MIPDLWPELESLVSSSRNLSVSHWNWRLLIGWTGWPPSPRAGFSYLRTWIAGMHHHTRLTYRLWVYKFSFSCCTASAVPAKPCSWSPKTLYNKEQMNIKNPEGDILSNVLREEILKIKKISQITCDKMWGFPQFRSKVIGKVNCIALDLYVFLWMQFNSCLRQINNRCSELW